MKKKKLSPLDEMISRFVDEFSKIPNFGKNMQDSDLNRVQTFTAVRLVGFHSTRNLLLNSFLPKTNELIAQTKQQMNVSIYKHILDTIDYDVDELRFETIRLGYVMVFHKYEVFVKDLLKMINEITECDETIEQYCKRVFGFNPKEWHSFPSIHKVNFISNCTKHQDGFCKLDKASSTIPLDFVGYPETKKINPSPQDYKKDIDLLIETVPILLNIVTFSNCLRAFDDVNLDFEDEIAEKITENTNILISVVKQQIEIYKAL